MRGINDLRERDVLKGFLRDWKCDLICFQETKLEEVSCSVIRSLWGTILLILLFLKLKVPLGAS